MNDSDEQSDRTTLHGMASADVALVKIVRNSAFNLVGTVLIVPFNFIALFTLAKRLGTDGLGTFFTIFAISAVIHWIADAGTTTVLTRRVARAQHELKNTVAEASGILVLVCLASACMFFTVAIPWMAVCQDHVSVPLLLLAAAAMASRHALDFAANVFRGLERFEFENLARVVQTFGFCLFVWFGVHQETGGVIAAFTAFLASNAIAALLIWAILLFKWNCYGFRLNLQVALDWWHESIPLGVGDVIRQLLLQLDTLMLSAFRPAGIVGLFSVAARPLQPLQLVPRIIVSVTFPMMSRAAHIDRDSLSRMFAQTTNLLWIASLPISILVSVCARPMILATAGPEFESATGPLQLLIWATALIFINAQLRFVLTALDAERQYRRLIVGVLVVKVALQLVLIPLAGIYGACLGNLLGEAFLCLWGLRILRELDVIGPTWTQLLKAIPAACSMAAVLILVVQQEVGLVVLALGGIVAMAVYGGVCLLCGAWPWSNVLRIWQIVRRPATYSAAVVPARVAVLTEAEAALT